MDGRGRDLRDRRRLPAPARDGPRDRRARRPPVPARAQGGDHPRRQQPAAAARGRRAARPPGDPVGPRVRGRHAGGRPALSTRPSSPGRWTRAIDARVEALTSSGLVNAAANRRALRVGEEPLESSGRTWPTYAREQAVCHLSPALVREPRAQLEREGAPGVTRRRDAGRASSCARCSSSGCARPSSACCRRSATAGRRGCATAGVTAAEDIGSLDDLARLAVHRQGRPARALPVRAPGRPARAARARARLERHRRQADRGRLHAGRPRRLGRGDGALHGDRRRAAGHARPQRQRLRAVHRRARLPPRRRAPRRDGPARSPPARPAAS